MKFTSYNLCTRCFAVCTAGAIAMTPDNEDVLRSLIGVAKCVGCGCKIHDGDDVEQDRLSDAFRRRMRKEGLFNRLAPKSIVVGLRLCRKCDVR